GVRAWCRTPPNDRVVSTGLLRGVHYCGFARYWLCSAAPVFVYGRKFSRPHRTAAQCRLVLERAPGFRSHGRAPGRERGSTECLVYRSQMANLYRTGRAHTTCTSTSPATTVCRTLGLY